MNGEAGGIRECGATAGTEPRTGDIGTAAESVSVSGGGRTNGVKPPTAVLAKGAGHTNGVKPPSALARTNGVKPPARTVGAGADSA
ncbi:hypothetical protein [Embleya sp. AB8]|uniref:hypothetical protein n=1 Tax=Embleya sp. AB8 TaxID=3156304 RepID=UPI003C741E51